MHCAFTHVSATRASRTGHKAAEEFVSRGTAPSVAAYHTLALTVSFVFGFVFEHQRELAEVARRHAEVAVVLTEQIRRMWPFLLAPYALAGVWQALMDLTADHSHTSLGNGSDRCVCPNRPEQTPTGSAGNDSGCPCLAAAQPNDAVVSIAHVLGRSKQAIHLVARRAAPVGPGAPQRVHLVAAWRYPGQTAHMAQVRQENGALWSQPTQTHYQLSHCLAFGSTGWVERPKECPPLGALLTSSS